MVSFVLSLLATLHHLMHHSKFQNFLRLVSWLSFWYGDLPVTEAIAMYVILECGNPRTWLVMWTFCVFWLWELMVIISWSCNEGSDFGDSTVNVMLVEWMLFEMQDLCIDCIWNARSVYCHICWIECMNMFFLCKLCCLVGPIKCFLGWPKWVLGRP